MSLHTLRAMARGGIYDQVGGGFCALRRRRDLDRAPLREDALRQRAAGAGLPARVAGVGRAAAAARVPRDARLGAARDARPRGRLLLGARRRLRGRRGQVLRLDGRASCATCSATSSTTRSPTSSAARELRARRQRARGARPRARAPARDPLQAVRRPRRAGPARARRQAADVLERADDLGAGRGRRGARPRADYVDAADRVRRVPARRLRDRRRAPAADLQGSRAAYLDDHAFLLEALLDPVRGDLRPALVPRGGGAGRHDHRALRATPSAAASSPPPPTTPQTSRGARTSRTRRSRRGARRPPTACCGWR